MVDTGSLTLEEQTELNKFSFLKPKVTLGKLFPESLLVWNMWLRPTYITLRNRSSRPRNRATDSVESFHWNVLRKSPYNFVRSLRRSIRSCLFQVRTIIWKLQCRDFGTNSSPLPWPQVRELAHLCWQKCPVCLRLIKTTSRNHRSFDSQIQWKRRRQTIRWYHIESC